MTSQPSSSTASAREHGGMAEHLDDDRLARLTEEERVAAGIDAYDPDEVRQMSALPRWNERR